MICNKCNHKLLENSKFCHICGNKLFKDVVPVIPVQKAQIEKEIEVKRIVHKKAVKPILFALLAAVAVAFAAVQILNIVIPASKYNHAQELLELGKYDLAYTAFWELGDYRDAENKLLESRYLQAVDYRKNGDYNVANKIFETLGDYRDSKALIHNHEYTISDVVASTCTTKGREISICSGCGDSIVKTLDVTPHNYVLAKEEQATCAATGLGTFTCIDCGDFYTKVTEKLSHNYILVKNTDAACDAPGEKSYSCSACKHTYSQKIPQKYHNWKDATCTVPKTCTLCGKTEGSALGHSDNVVCTRCGANIFGTKKYTGSGVSNITNINLPEGKYNFIFTHDGDSNFIVRFSKGGTEERLIINEIGKVSYVYQISSSSTAKIENGYINITHADGNWTLTIEAIGN